MPGALVIGVGRGLGAALALMFAREGLPVSLVARRRESLAQIASRITDLGVHALQLPADAADEESLRRAIDAAVDQLGVPEVVVYNAALVRRDAPGELSAVELQAAYAVNVLGAATAAARVGPAMAARGRGSFLITSGMPQPDARYTSLSMGKATVRALADLLHQQLGLAGVHVATVTVHGEIRPGTRFDPDEIAQAYWAVHQQPRAEWELDHAYDGVEAPPLTRDRAG